MEKLAIRMACGTYDRMEALRNGAVQVEGVALAVHQVHSPDCDIHEMDLAQYLIAKAGGAPLIAIPVFPLRRFYRDHVFVNGAAGIDRPMDLIGKRVGVAPAGAADSRWICGLLAREHGVEPGSFQLLVSAEEELAAKLARGEIDAGFGRRLRTLAGVRPLFPDAVTLDRDSWRRNGIFPILTTLVMSETLHAQQPWLAESLFKACEEAKRWCIRQMRFSGALRMMLPWLLDEIDAMDDMFGADPWPYGLETNRKTLEMAVQLLQEQGQIAGPVDLDRVFTPIIAWAE